MCSVFTDAGLGRRWDTYTTSKSCHLRFVIFELVMIDHTSSIKKYMLFFLLHRGSNSCTLLSHRVPNQLNYSMWDKSSHLVTRLKGPYHSWKVLIVVIMKFASGGHRARAVGSPSLAVHQS
eukprot:TRINITY_DN2006_c0_g1_i4.p1 TRINITY_DN2006_c0_g1~~TRINITY_DN2006_c0_g1_i4.p1  ORF type:complete len:121 (-),score=5.58 TRINITY_DN2006_c0_g1_i4:1233-1595(-)